MINHKKGFLLCACACVAYHAPQAMAQSADTADKSQGIQEIIVTAERRQSDVQGIATAVTVRSGDELASQGKYSLRQVLDDIPGVVVLDNNSNNTGSADVQGNNITIRGITPGTSAGASNSQISATPATAVYVDGIYEGIGSGYDLERVEVLRGPQGTLYGRSATAGVIAFHTRNPTLEDLGADFSAEYGSYQLQHYSGALNIPLGSTLAVRLSGDYRNQEKGYFDNAKLGMRERTNMRAKLLWEPSDSLSVLVGYAYEKDNAKSGGSQIFADTNLDYTVATAPVFPGHKEQNQYWAEINWDIGPATITYQPAYRTWMQDDYYLQSANFLGSGAQLQQFIRTPKDYFHTQELRIASNGDSAIKWLAGAFYYENVLETSNRNFLADSSGNELSLITLTSDKKKTTDLGFFAEATYTPTPNLRLTLGARYDYTKVTVSEESFESQWSLCGTTLAFIVQPTLEAMGETCTGPGQASIASAPGSAIENQSATFRNFNYKARIEYDLTPKNMLYGLVATGFRPGDIGIVSDGQGGYTQNKLDAEKLTSFEIGSKNRFLDNTLQVNLTGYYYVYEGFQTSFNIDPYTFTNPIRVTVPARNLGVELEAVYKPTPRDQFAVNYNYTQSRWVNKPGSPDDPTTFAGAQPETMRAMTPHTMTASYQHTFELNNGGTIDARIDGKFESAHLAENLHRVFVDAGYNAYVHVADRTIGNAQITFTTEDKRYSLTAYVRNFTNAKYVTYDLGSDPSNMNVLYVDPRVFGIVASVRL